MRIRVSAGSGIRLNRGGRARNPAITRRKRSDRICRRRPVPSSFMF